MTEDAGPERREEPPGWNPLRSDAPVSIQLSAAPAGRRWRSRSADRSDQSTADWAWVEEWRRGGEPTPWGPGLALAGFAGLIIGIAVYVISAGLSDRPIIAIGANIVVAAGLSPALWMSRQLPVLRWISLGGGVGTVVAWISILFFPNI